MNHQSLSADLSPCPNPAPLPLQGRVDLCPSTAGNRRPTPHPVFNLQAPVEGMSLGLKKSTSTRQTSRGSSHSTPGLPSQLLECPKLARSTSAPGVGYPCADKEGL